jgi:hypothetical protein
MVSFTIQKGSDKERKYLEECLIRRIKPIYNIKGLGKRSVNAISTAM